jgi:transcriptional regulator with XRE-family HTH domain
MGMAWKAWDSREFERQLRIKRPGFHRQTVNKWFQDEVKQLSPDYLFLVADVLDCNPRWLALREGEPQRQPELDLDEVKTVQLYRAFKQHSAHRDQWLKQGSELLQLETGAGTSVAQPFAKQDS